MEIQILLFLEMTVGYIMVEAYPLQQVILE
jgi:hypothetical protein